MFTDKKNGTYIVGSCAVLHEKIVLRGQYPHHEIRPPEVNINLLSIYLATLSHPTCTKNAHLRYCIYHSIFNQFQCYQLDYLIVKKQTFDMRMENPAFWQFLEFLVDESKLATLENRINHSLLVADFLTNRMQILF